MSDTPAELPEILADRSLSLGIVTPEDCAAMTGLETVERMCTGALPMPLMLGVLPLLPHAWRAGEMEFRAFPERRFSNAIGSVHGGWAMTMLDTAMGFAAHTTLNPGELYTSVDTSVRFVRPIFEKTSELRIIGTVLSRGRTVITVEGRLVDLENRLYAVGSSSCMVIRDRT